MTTLYGRNLPTAAPTRRTIDIRSLCYGVSGPERPYPVYQFSNRAMIEYPRHNPFGPTALGAQDNLGANGNS